MWHEFVDGLQWPHQWPGRYAQLREFMKACGTRLSLMARKRLYATSLVSEIHVMSRLYDKLDLVEQVVQVMFLSHQQLQV